MADSLAVAGELWESWVPRNLRRLIGDELPGGETDGAALVRFLAASHDIGKCTPAFACQVEALIGPMRDCGLEMRSAKEYGLERRRAPHGLAGQLLIQRWLSERHGFTGREAAQFAVVAGGHHGTPPDHQQIHDLRSRWALLRHPGQSEAVWERTQWELLDWCARAAGVEDRLEAWRSVRLSQPVQVVLTGLVIMADWIASASELFPYDPATWLPFGEEAERRRLTAAWRGLDLPGPWLPEPPDGDASSLIASRFTLPDGAVARPVQVEAVEMARRMPSAGLLMIEAPMGEGKTEAAFAAAEVLGAQVGAGGVLIALPTRATSDAMLTRFVRWLDGLPMDGRKSIVLSHAKAALNDVWAGLMRDGRRQIAAVELDGEEEAKTNAGKRERRVGERMRKAPATLHAHQWLRGKKKALLSSFAVGTIDQVLFGGLKSRHLALRHLAFAGKVVVIDEVHAYDAYMSRYLDRVLEWLAAYRVPVVLLSATLPSERRRALARAYADVELPDLPDDAYPLITAIAPDAPVLMARPEAASGRRTEVSLRRLDDDLSSLEETLREHLADGGCALVVRNTVDRVLEAADRLRARFGDDAVLVAHSRFTATDRAERDASLLSLFGPEGDRPGLKIVVASQVVEQSLDVDFDLLVTDAAPVDLVLQRMGRLHRHRRARPDRLSEPVCYITGVDWDVTPPLPIRGSEAVYQGKHTLLRGLATLWPYLDGPVLPIPDMISPLVQQAYGDTPIGPESWAETLQEAQIAYSKLLREKLERAGGFLLGPVRPPGRPLFSWLEAHAGDAEDSRPGRAQVRDSEETLEVLVIQRTADGSLRTLPWLGKGRAGLELPEHAIPSLRACEAVAASALNLPWQFSSPWKIDATIDELEKNVIDAWQAKECPWLAGELLLVLDENCQTRLAGCDLRYSQIDGLRVVQQDKTGNSSETDRECKEKSDMTHAMLEQQSITPGKSPGRDADPLTFNLVNRPWIPVQRIDGRTESLSLLDVFTQARSVRRLVGDLPTQDLALTRLLLAITYDALDGPRTLDDWLELWESDDPFDAVADYLRQHHDRFDLLHPETPFFQVAGLRTDRNEIASLNRIVADVPNGDPFFAMRQPRVDRLDFAEAARWLVHTHAFDPSGIKSGMVGDDRVKGGKVYPLGVGSAGNLGGVMAEADTLHETLLLNLIAFDEQIVAASSGADLPAWRRPPTGPGVEECDPGLSRPTGLRELYTWQSRRVLLHHDGASVTGVVLGYGDPLNHLSPWNVEPMTIWRRSATQEKKQGRSPVHMPRQHDPSRAAWRGLSSLLHASDSLDAASSDRSGVLRPGVVRWLTYLSSEEYLSPGRLIRLRLVGAIYGTQQSVIDEVFDDTLIMPAVLLHRERPQLSATALDAVAATDKAVGALGRLAGNLALAAGRAPDPSAQAARDLGYGALDGPYRQWLAALTPGEQPGKARDTWFETARTIIGRLGDQQLAAAGHAAAEGRKVQTPRGEQWIDDALAHLWFTSALRKALPKPSPPAS